MAPTPSKSAAATREELWPWPPTVDRVLRPTAKLTTEQCVSLGASDPALTVRVLQVANSAQACFGPLHTTVTTAARSLGRPALTRILQASCRLASPEWSTLSGFPEWLHAATRGFAAALLAAHVGSDKGNAFTAAVLADLGSTPTRQHEAIRRGADFERAVRLAESCDVPAALLEALRDVRGPEATPVMSASGLVLFVADRAAIGRSTRRPVAIDDTTLMRLAIGRDELDQLAEDAWQQARATANRLHLGRDAIR